jgi:hypothetical protein
MKNKLIRLSLCLLSLAAARVGAEGPKHPSRKLADGTEIRPHVNTCRLLTSTEIQAVQGEPVQETKPSSQPGAGLVMSQCLFRTSTPDKSVSLAVAAPSSLKPRAFWMSQFHPRKAETDENEKQSAGKATKKPVAERKQEDDDEGARPRVIAGVGEEAYWVGGPVVGALYVLRGETFLRISVGGVREESRRIEKSIALARAALKRM